MQRQAMFLCLALWLRRSAASLWCLYFNPIRREGPRLAVIMPYLLKPTALCEVVVVAFCVQVGVTAAIATSVSEAAKGGRSFVLRPNNDAEVFKLCTKDAVQLQPKSMIRLC